MTLTFAPKRSSDRTLILSDERLGAKLRVIENRCVLFNPSSYILLYSMFLCNFTETFPTAKLLDSREPFCHQYKVTLRRLDDFARDKAH